MASHKVLLLGATGETGGDILDGLLEDGGFDITCLARPASANNTKIQGLKDRGVKVVVADITEVPEKLARSLEGYDTIISALGALEQLLQLNLVEAIAIAGVKRFVPCGFITIAPRGGIMIIRDQKEEVHDRIFQHKIPYTIIDVGYWHQISFPRLASGKLDYVIPDMLKCPPRLLAGGTAKNILTDKRDMGRFTARIIKDPRTLNKRVFTWSDCLSQKEIFALLEKVSGEKVTEVVEVSAEELLKDVADARDAYESSGGQPMKSFSLFPKEYEVSKYVREDNTPENGEYLGYLDARKLYPDFQPISFESYLNEVLAGRGGKPPYADRFK